MRNHLYSISVPGYQRSSNWGWRRSWGYKRSRYDYYDEEEDEESDDDSDDEYDDSDDDDNDDDDFDDDCEDEDLDQDEKSNPSNMTDDSGKHFLQKPNLSHDAL